MLLLSIEERMQFGIEEIYLRYHGDMLRLAKYRLKQANVPHYRTEAEDVVQNALLKLTKYARHISPDATEKEIKNYVLTVVGNEANNLIGRLHPTEELNEGAVATEERDFLAALHIKERYRAVVEGIAAMEERYRTVLYLRYCKEMNAKEIAALLGISTKTVYTRLERGKRILVARLKEETV